MREAPCSVRHGDDLRHCSERTLGSSGPVVTEAANQPQGRSTAWKNLAAGVTIATPKTVVIDTVAESDGENYD